MGPSFQVLKSIDGVTIIPGTLSDDGKFSVNDNYTVHFETLESAAVELEKLRGLIITSFIDIWENKGYIAAVEGKPAPISLDLPSDSFQSLDLVSKYLENNDGLDLFIPEAKDSGVTLFFATATGDGVTKINQKPLFFPILQYALAAVETVKTQTFQSFIARNPEDFVNYSLKHSDLS